MALFFYSSYSVTPCTDFACSTSGAAMAYYDRPSALYYGL